MTNSRNKKLNGAAIPLDAHRQTTLPLHGG